MRKLFATLALLLVLGTAAAQDAATQGATPEVEGLKLPAPMKVPAGSGYIKLVAKAEGPVVFDVFAVFEDPETRLQFDQDGPVVYVGIPASAGAIRICACTVVGGKPSKIASTIITVEAKKDPPPQPPPQPAPVAGPKLHVSVIGSPESPVLRQALEAAGCAYWPLAAPRADMADRVRAVGLPAVLVQDGDGKVLAVEKYVSDAGVIAVVNRLRGK